jgi:non-heme chloroperoxidase
MSTFTTQDGASIYYKDWGAGQPILFSHGWPLSADAWEDQMEFLANNGFRCIAHDRRGHGRSSQPWLGNDMGTYAADLAALIEYLDIHDAILVGHSTGGGEVARYIGGYGTSRVAKAVLIGSVTPLMLQTPANPIGLPLEVFDGIRVKVSADRSQFFHDLPETFYGTQLTEGLRNAFWRQGMQASLHGAFACIEAFSATDFTADLAHFQIPTLIIHGDADQIVPISASALRTAALIPGATLKVYPGAPHGLCSTHKHIVNADLLAFCKS